MTIDPRDIEDREGLAMFLEGKADPAINDAALAVGSGTILAKVFSAMEHDYDPANGPKDRVVVQWSVKVPEGGIDAWQLAADRERCVATQGTPDKPDITLTVGMPAFLKIVVGKLSGLKALSTGKLKLKGELMLATSIEGWFLAR
jgi:hypothetical protein